MSPSQHGSECLGPGRSGGMDRRNLREWLASASRRARSRLWGVELSRRIESAVFEDLPGRRFDKRAERVFGAVAALAGHTEFVLQLLQGSDAARRRGADLPVGDAVANANVHVRVARCSSVDKVNVVKIRIVVNIQSFCKGVKPV